MITLPYSLVIEATEDPDSPDSALAKTNFQKKRKILRVGKRSALRKARSVPLFDA
jgi:hypothetical protein